VLQQNKLVADETPTNGQGRSQEFAMGDKGGDLGDGSLGAKPLVAGNTC